MTATWPKRLNQPVNQLHAPELFSESLPAQKYSPPAVGYAEAISAIPSPTTSVIAPTMSQPQTMTTGPP